MSQENVESKIENPAPEAVDPADIPLSKKPLDKGFKRNISIIGLAIVVAVASIAAIVFFARQKIATKQSTIAATNIPANSGFGGGKPADLTPVDAERLSRLQSRESDSAKASKETYIPSDLPLKSELRAPEASNAGPGNLGQRGYTDAQGQALASDPAREANIKRGLDLQVASLLSKFEAPGTGSAGAYSNPNAEKNAAASKSAASAAATPSSGSASAALSPEVLARGVKFAGARLVSPLDTSRTDFISAEITSGPFAGAYLTGKGKLVEEKGVTLDFNRMSFDGDDYAVDIKALDSATSSDSVSADIDRKLLSRTVIPVLFSTAQAYLNAVASPGATVVAGGFATQVVTPAAQGRQAAAAGLAAGIATAGTGFSNQKPSAYMPVNSPVSLLFNTPVLKKTTK